MKSPFSLACCTVGLLCFALSAPLAVANPLKSIGSSLKKAGNALNPFKKSEAKPAPATPAPAPAAKAKAKPTAAKATKPAAAKKKKPTAAAKSKPAAEASKTAAAAAGTTAAAATTANGTDAKVDSTETPPETAPGAAPSDTAPAPPAAAPVPLAKLPFGIPVMGRKGYVRSPYAEDQGMVDVNDIPAGAKVKCPFTGKVFRVP